MNWDKKSQRRPAYRTVHNRLNSQRGKASEKLCIDCGDSAQHWSYDGRAERELTQVDSRGFTLTYTEDLSRYDPRCRQCHHDYDRSRPSTCPQGHPYSDENTWVKATGVRVCRECSSARYREWKARKRAEAGLPAERVILRSERSPTAKLTWGDVRKMRSLHADGATYAQIQESVGVSRSTVWRVVTGLSWKEEENV